MDGSTARITNYPKALQSGRKADLSADFFLVVADFGVDYIQIKTDENEAERIFIIDRTPSALDPSEMLALYSAHLFVPLFLF